MAFDLNSTDTLMGWNQLVQIDLSGIESSFGLENTGTQVLRVDNYNIGVSQTSDAPDYVTGRQDRTAWKRGPITSQGDLAYPFTLSTGIDMFTVAAELAEYPKNAFSIESSVHPRMSGCKINTSELSCTAENEVTANSQVWGIVDDDALTTIRSYGEDARISWGGGTVDNAESPSSLSNKQVGSSSTSGVVEGVNVDNQLVLEQIPMFDACSVVGAPAGMFVIGFSISIDNQLQRNYTMGTGAAGADEQYSPLGLNATTISAGQRRITGTITWQSDFEGYISQILGSGISSLIIRIAEFELTMNNALWMAEPPTLSAGDRVTCQSSFIALGTGTTAFDALLIGSNTSPPPGL